MTGRSRKPDVMRPHAVEPHIVKPGVVKPGAIPPPTVAPGAIRGHAESSPPHRAEKDRNHTPDAGRVAAFRLGLSAESRAAAFLIAKGYRILARRWRSPFGEIDIIARRRQTLIFVEVKARLTVDAAAEAVTMRQRRRIAAAAELWLAQHADIAFTDVRFDAVLVAPGRMPQHIASAFDATI
jgi:putative endonuclease